MQRKPGIVFATNLSQLSASYHVALCQNNSYQTPLKHVWRLKQTLFDSALYRWWHVAQWVLHCNDLAKVGSSFHLENTCRKCTITLQEGALDDSVV